MKKKLLSIVLIFFGSISLIVNCNIGKKDNTSKPQAIAGNTQWTITQFGQNNAGQMMCYTIEGNKEGLVIIDGGYMNDDIQKQFLMDKISKHNNVVDSWIITHFDIDHGGQFVEFASSDDVEIKQIYVHDAPTDLELLKAKAPHEEHWEVYEAYLNMELPQQIKVHNNDSYNVIGLKMNVLSSYEDWINEKSNNLLNNGSIVFKLYGNKESILFCADVQDKLIGEYLISNCKDKLKSDYLQVAHHGNNNLGEKFYKLVSPKVALFPAPDWLMNNENNISWFTVGENREILEKLGAKIVWHNTSPDEFILK